LEPRETRNRRRFAGLRARGFWPGARSPFLVPLLLDALIGLGVRQVQSMLYELRDADYLFLEPIRAGVRGAGRAGIFLRRRLNPDLPVEAKPLPPEAVARLWEARRKLRTGHEGNCAPGHEGNCAQNQEALEERQK